MATQELQALMIKIIRKNQVGNKSQFNQKPKEDEEYILVKFKIKVLENKDDKVLDINSTLFSLVNEEGVLYDGFDNVGRSAGLDPSIKTEIYPGGTYEGWIDFKVKKNDSPLIVVNNE